ncbi:MAG TPA: SDR family oxidoreductase [Nitrospiraceae bacterium]|nr:SDR family oxidoreductase [Nitrospiraceae bacterium]
MAGLNGKVAIVTGASRGIGRAIAERLAQDGASVVVNYTRNADEAKKVVAGIEDKGGRAIAIQADVGRIADVRRLFQEVHQAFGRLDILINNAGIFWPKPLAEVTEREYDEMFSVNAKGPLFAMQEAAKRMADGGRIVNLSTGGTQLAFPGISLYGGSKSALEFFTKVAAKELGSRAITVNTIAPGYTETDMLPSDPSFRQMGEQSSPLKRLGTPKDIADVVAFIVSDDARWITGGTIQAGGGVVI